MVADVVSNATDSASHFSIPNLVFENRTRLDATQFDTVDQHGSSFHVVAVKAAYQLGACDAKGIAALSPIVGATLNIEDRYFDDDQDTGVRQESDFAPYKPACDVIVNATAHAPGGQPATEFQVRLSVYKLKHPNNTASAAPLIDKHLDIGGERSFQKKCALWRLLQWAGLCATFGLVKPNPWRSSVPHGVTSVPLRYTFANGGQCRIDEGGTSLYESSEENPVGRGFARRWYLDAKPGKSFAAPQISALGGPLTALQFWHTANGAALPAPVGMGVVGRGWLPRRLLTGTFENKVEWGEDEVPRLPMDFDFAWYNCAPRDQQCPYLGGRETFSLMNLCNVRHPSATHDIKGNTLLRFSLPLDQLFLMAVDGDSKLMFQRLVIDTVVIEPDENRVDVVWRTLLATDIDLRVARLMQISEPEQIARLDHVLQGQEALSQAASADSQLAGAAQ